MHRVHLMSKASPHSYVHFPEVLCKKDYITHTHTQNSNNNIPIAAIIGASYKLKLAMFFMLTSSDKANAHKPSSIDVEFITVYNIFL